MVQKHTRYVKNGGKKSLLQRMEDQRVKELREEVKEALGRPGMPPARATVKLADLESDRDVFLDFLVDVRKENDGLLRSGACCAQKSSYMYLFRRYRCTPSRAFEEDLKEGVEGIKRMHATLSMERERE